MANPIKGEVTATVAGTPFTLAFDFNALCTLEDDLGVGVDELDGKLSSVSSLRTIFRVALEAHHGKLSDLEAGRLIQELGVVEAGALVVQAFQGAFPPPSAEGNAPTPAKKTGTGRGR